MYMYMYTCIYIYIYIYITVSPIGEVRAGGRAGGGPRAADPGVRRRQGGRADRRPGIGSNNT